MKNSGRMCHRIYAKAHNKDDIRLDIITTSLYLLQSRPNFHLAKILSLDPANFLAVIIRY